MAHPCYGCGGKCNCLNDKEPEIINETPAECDHCVECNKGDDDFDDEEMSFQSCDRCDGHDACADYGCAFENGCGHLVKSDNPLDW